MRVERKIEGVNPDLDVTFRVQSGAFDKGRAVVLSFSANTAVKRTDSFEMSDVEALAMAVELIKAVQRNAGA